MNLREIEDKFHEGYQSLTETNCQRFGQVVEKILKSTFVVRAQSDDYQDYVFITEHKSLFEAFFSLLGEEFDLDVSNSFAYVKSASGRMRVRLRKFDTLILLVLRLTYHQKMKEAGTFDRVVQVTVGELIEKAGQTGVVDKDLAKKTYYMDTLVKLRKHRIIDYSASQIDDGTTINILPSILALIPQDSIDEITNRIKLFGKSSDDVEGGDDDEEAE